MGEAKRPAGMRRVWRITTDHPQGAIVDPEQPEEPKREHSEHALPPDTSFRSSSWDLLNGVEVTDESDTIPDDLFEQLFKG